MNDLVKEALELEAEAIKRGWMQPDYESISFPAQYSFIKDESKFVSALCTRRAGKSNGLAIKFFLKAMKHKRALIPYFALTRDSAKNIMWTILQETADKMRVKAEFTESKLEVNLENGSVIKLFGADMKNFIGRIKGIKCPLAAIDEAGEFGAHLESLIDDILTPAIGDYLDGQIYIAGTPGSIPFGYFYDVTERNKYGYSRHFWSLHENPFFPNSRAFVADIKAKKGWLDDSPTYLREYCGKWVKDIDSLVFKYDPIINHYEALPQTKSGKWNYIIGVDIGFKDADAIAVIAWHEYDKLSYLVEEDVGRGRDITELALNIRKFVDKYDPIKVVMDTGGLGVKISEELRRRFSLPVVSAEKSRKFEFIQLMNDSLRNGRFLASNKSHFANDCMLLEWDKDRMAPDRLVVSDKFHSDITDAVLYAFRESLDWLSEDEVIAPIPHTDAWFKQQEEQMFQNLLDRQNEEKMHKLMMFGEE